MFIYILSRIRKRRRLFATVAVIYLILEIGSYFLVPYLLIMNGALLTALAEELK